jgi:hypothetical protein
MDSVSPGADQAVVDPRLSIRHPGSWRIRGDAGLELRGSWAKRNALDRAWPDRYGWVVLIALATRLLVVLLVLSSTGVLPAAARLAHAGCEDGAGAGPGHSGGDEGRCRDCSPNCAVCVCCPLRAASTMQLIGVAPLEHHPQRARFAETSGALPGITAAIFHPPRV